MDFLKKVNWKKLPLLKVLGIAVVGIIILTIATAFFGFAIRTVFNSGGNYGSINSYPQEVSKIGYYEDSLSVRNVVAPTPPIFEGGYTTGDSEAFEITEYNGTIRTGNLDKTCSEIEVLKAHDYVIFENANKYKRNCNYSFKVENDYADEILAIIQTMKFETLDANTHTIKNLVDDYTSEVEILQKRLVSIEETLISAQNAYDELSRLATKTQDVESLAKIIDSKIKLIERLTTQRINTKESIDKINRSKTEQLDRLKYTFFKVSAYEYLLVDGKQIRDSWVYELQRFVKDVNSILQETSVGLVSFLLRLIQVAIYFVLALIVVKYGWRFIKRLWKL